MAPAAITPPATSTTDLTTAAIKTTIEKSAPSLAPAALNPSTLAELDASRLSITRTTTPRAVPAPNSAAVWAQSTCTDHMVTVSWNASSGWAAPEIKPYGPLSLWPTASCLHYATECFEGMKVYRGFDKKLRLFRPDKNAARMVMSSTRIALPAFPPAELEKLVKELVKIDGAKWLPKSRPGEFLYVRPTMIGTGEALGVQKPRDALLFILLAPFPDLSSQVPPNVPTPVRPGLKLLASKDDMIRAWPGGFGYAKVGANYGPSLIAQAEARARGFDQILWLFGEEGFVTEAGASNFFVVWRTKEGRTQLITAPLEQRIILDGVTRRSVLELARERLTGAGFEGVEGLEVVERKFTMAEVKDAYDEGRLVEAFAAGTAFFIAPISTISYREKELNFPIQGDIGAYAGIIKQWLRGIMYGKENHPWGVVCDEE